MVCVQFWVGGWGGWVVGRADGRMGACRKGVFANALAQGNHAAHRPRKRLLFRGSTGARMLGACGYCTRLPTHV